MVSNLKQAENINQMTATVCIMIDLLTYSCGMFTTNCYHIGTLFSCKEYYDYKDMFKKQKNCIRKYKINL